MASLLEREHLGRSVQCIYMDPPYGMDFDARYMEDTVAVCAFRDSYDDGINSYLDALRETLTLARELLTESGSLFMQIGDVNVHRAALVLDDVFGAENRVSTISYATTGGGSSTKSIRQGGRLHPVVCARPRADAVPGVVRGAVGFSMAPDQRVFQESGPA